MAKLKLFFIALVTVALAAPAALAALGGSGQVTDIVQLSTTTGTLSALSSAGTPIASTSAFTMTNSGSNVDTLIRYAWGTTPYYGSSTSATSISIRGTTYYVSDMLWLKQQTLAADATATTSDIFTPLIIRNAASVTTATFSSSGNACTGWTGSAGSGFSAAAAGTFTFKYHSSSSQTDNSPTTSDTFHYCLDTTNTQVYLGKSAAFTSATRIYPSTSESTGGVLNTYRYQVLPNSVTSGNHYCITAYTGTGTSATPDLSQCQALPYETLASTTAKLFVLLDTPSYFPSLNQGGTITYGVAGTQWNPYAASTTNTA